MGGGSTKLTRKINPSQGSSNGSPESIQVEGIKPQHVAETGSQHTKSKSKQLSTIHIYFGSNSGCAEQFSLNLKCILNSKGITARVINLDDFHQTSLLSCSLAIFLVATAGDGEPTDNALNFAEWYHNRDNELPNDLLAKLHFMVFGLGNRTYEFFNRMGKMTQLHLEKLGGKPLHPLTEGDASDDIDSDYQHWRDTIIPKIQKFLEHQKQQQRAAAANN